jgi:hypothetical protein
MEPLARLEGGRPTRPLLPNHRNNGRRQGNSRFRWREGLLHLRCCRAACGARGRDRSDRADLPHDRPHRREPGREHRLRRSSLSLGHTDSRRPGASAETRQHAHDLGQTASNERHALGVDRARKACVDTHRQRPTAFTPKRSLVRTQYRPPHIPPGQRAGTKDPAGPSSSSSPSSASEKSEPTSTPSGHVAALAYGPAMCHLAINRRPLMPMSGRVLLAAD